MHDVPTWLAAKAADHQAIDAVIALSFVYVVAVWGIPFARRRWRAPVGVTQAHSAMPENPNPEKPPAGIYDFALALNVQKIWVQMNHLKDLVIHINIDIFNGNGEDIYLKGINGHILLSCRDQNSSDIKRGKLTTPSFSETRRNHIPAHDEYSFTLTQSVPKKLAEDLSNWGDETVYVLDFEALNIIVQSTNNPDRAARLPLWNGGALKQHNGGITTTKITQLRPGRLRGMSQFGVIETPSPQKDRPGRGG